MNPENESVPASKATTLAGSAAPSRAASVKKEAHSAPSSRPGSTFHPQDELDGVPSKDRAPPFVVALCLFQSLAGLLFGWEQGVIAGLTTNPVYQRRFGEPDPTSASGYSLPSTRLSLITGFMSLGALFGALLIGQLLRRTGIKIAIIFSLVIYAAGIAIETSGQSQYGQEIAGRFVTGFGVGSLSLLAPLYQAECSPKHLRGLITSTYQLMATIGIFLSNAVNYAQHDKGTDFSWRFPIAIQFIWAAVVFVGTVLAPESPRYYVQRDNVDRARVNLAKLRGLDEQDPELLAELDVIIKGVEDEKLAADATYLDCFRMKDRMLLRTMNGVMVQWGQQWSGVNFFFSYGNKFFATSGIKDPYQTQLILSGINVVATFPGILAVDRLGRRTLLFIGSAMMFSGQIIAGSVSTAKPNDPAAGKALIFASCWFIAGFACSWGPLGWVVAAEQFPLKIAPLCVSLATASNWLNNFIIAIIVPYITDPGYGNIGTKITFMWAGTEFLAFLYTFFFIPETKGLSLVQVDELYLTGVPAWRSASWTPYGGATARNQKDRDEAKRLKLGTEASHHENVPTKRNLAEDV
ncbi:putative Galactose transporter (putative) [Rhodotorula toruloides]|uniref:BY PROTMAP: gi/472581777/gb/EMS19492.1/ MFS transporter, sugar:H+ symporter [Rhodosporidium toruloides NP11] gi/647402513/emb/CDR48746.1/ RHTO0S20e00496g1_1 [Rhodosporidium toruloides] n=1 Tax=Rhodotorula toruloides TaxID=5286 RepID=A0A0K3CUF1_RHOTO|nr:putative Galactose transporter (putative) [Rhodotorula toruloides]PRQ70326.1 Sugar (and other) transporter-domain containing protein [Rhodotorula toruloides]